MMEYKELPIFKKGMEIVEITRAIVSSFKETEESRVIGDLMMENAYLIPAKIANAEGGDLYSHRMDMATLIKLSARELGSQTTLCGHMQLADKDYLRLLQSEIDNFRTLFIAWVDSFDVTNDVEDSWGLPR